MPPIPSRLASILLLALLAAPAFAGDWPAWRGPTHDGQCDEKDLPLTWSATEGVAWKAPLPGEGNSTPVVWGDRIFLTCAEQKGKLRSLLCLDRAGKELWRSTVTHADPEPTHETNPYCSASPVTDGRVVVASHGSAGLFAHDFAGKRLWHADLGKLTHIWGNGSSPVIHGDLVIHLAGPGLRAFLVALDKRTGQEKWRRDLPEATAAKPGDFLGAWSSPVPRRRGGRNELLLSLPKRLAAFDPATGEPLWHCAGMGDLAYTSPVHAGDIVVSMSGYHGPALAVAAAADAQGDLTARRLWRLDDAKAIPQRVGSGVLVDGHVYILNDSGFAACFEAATGKTVWSQRVGRGNSWGSMVHAGGRLYVLNTAGQCLVLDASPRFKLLATNELGETCRSSPAISDGQILLRTYQQLWCVGERKR